MSSTPAEHAPRRGRPIPPDRLAAVLDEVDRARRTGGWIPEEPVDGGRRAGRRRSPVDGRPHGAEGEDAADEGRSPDPRPRHLQSGREDVERPHTPLLRPPRSLRDALVAPGRLAALTVIVLVIAAGAVLGGRLLWLRATSAPQPADPGAAAAAATGLQGTPRASGAAVPAPSTPPPNAPSAAGPTTMLVHVVGQVKRPGVVTLRPGARVSDALEAAGGARETADLGRLNLARPVTDGEQVAVPKPGEEITQAPGPMPAPGGSGAAPGGGAAPQSAAPVDLNQADGAALEELPGVGPVLAGRIVQWRTDNGPFTAVDELAEVSGIGEKMLAQLRPLVTV